MNSLTFSRGLTRVLFALMGAWVLPCGMSTLGCSSDSTPPSAGAAGAAGAGGSTTNPCLVGYPLADGTCVEAGVPAQSCGQGFTSDGQQGCEPVLPTQECAVGTMPMIGQADCQPVGIPSGQGLICATGFVSDGSGGCDPVLPPMDCPTGLMAVPGDTECHEPQACGVGTWGNIPVDATTQYVDASYSGGGSDGSMSKPWVTIAEGISHASAGQVVAVAAGTYPENLQIKKGIKLWGVCPSKVNLVGSVAGSSTLYLSNIPVADTAEVHGIGISGLDTGVHVTARNVLLSGVWIHDTGGEQVGILVGNPATHLTVSDSLLEAIPYESIMVFGSTVDVVRSHVRDTLTNTANGAFGRGIEVSSINGAAATLNVSGSLLERNYESSLKVSGSSATVVGSVIRDTKPAAGDASKGFGVYVDSDTDLRGNLVIGDSVIDGNYSAGVDVLGADATIFGSVIRNTQCRASDHKYGYGVIIEPQGDSGSTLTLTDSLIENNHDAGLRVKASEATVERTIIRNTQPVDANQQLGLGIDVFSVSGHRGNLVLNDSVIEKNRELGVSIVGADATVRGTVVRDTQSQASDKKYGYGIGVKSETDMPGKLSLSGSLLENNTTFGLIVYAADATVDGSTIRGTVPREADLLGGEGIFVQDNGSLPSTLSMSGTLVDSNHSTGVLITGATANIQSSVIRNTISNEVFGAGIAALQYDDVPCSLSLDSSLLDNNSGVAIILQAVSATVQSSVIRNTTSDVNDSEFGYGIISQASGDIRGSLTLSSSTLVSNRSAGLSVVKSDAVLQGVLVRRILADENQKRFGDAVTASLSTISLENCLFEENERAAVSNFGSNVTVERVEVVCSPILFNVENTTADPLAEVPIPEVEGTYVQHQTQCLDCNGQVIKCTAVSSHLEAPKPVKALTPLDSQ